MPRLNPVFLGASARYEQRTSTTNRGESALWRGRTFVRVPRTVA
ncbi:hypothetical protein ACFOLD_01335 [Kocuria carniphila]